jgi:hypothetical protein
MKINELIQSFEIYKTNEEIELLDKMDVKPQPLSSYTEREQVIIDNMVKKSLVSKIRNKDLFLVLRND